jgi:hypothetical protein
MKRSFFMMHNYMNLKKKWSHTDTRGFDIDKEKIFSIGGL